MSCFSLHPGPKGYFLSRHWCIPSHFHMSAVLQQLPQQMPPVVTIQTHNSFQQTEDTVGRRMEAGRAQQLTTSSTAGLGEADPGWASSHILQPYLCPGRAAGSTCPCKRGRGGTKARFRWLWGDRGYEAGSQGGQPRCSLRQVAP